MWSDLPDDVELIERKVRVKGVDINHVVTKLRGSNPEKVLVLLPGTLGSSYLDFKPQLYVFPRLLPNYSIISIDPIGFGKSIPPARNICVDMFRNDAETLHELMKILHVPKFSILGTSGGAITAMHFTIKYPNVVEKLIVVAANSFMTRSELEVYEGMKDTDTWSETTRKPLDDFYGRDFVKDTWARFVECLWRIYDEGGGDYCKRELKDIKADTLVILGENDVMIDQSHRQYYKENIKSCQLVIFPNGSHKMHLKFPDEFCKIVVGFLMRKSRL